MPSFEKNGSDKKSSHRTRASWGRIDRVGAVDAVFDDVVKGNGPKKWQSVPLEDLATAFEQRSKTEGSGYSSAEYKRQLSELIDRLSKFALTYQPAKAERKQKPAKRPQSKVLPTDPSIRLNKSDISDAEIYTANIKREPDGFDILRASKVDQNLDTNTLTARGVRRTTGGTIAYSADSISSTVRPEKVDTSPAAPLEASVPQETSSYEETRKRIRDLALATRGEQGLVDRYGESDFDFKGKGHSEEVSSAFKEAKNKWRKDPVTGAKDFPHKDARAWYESKTVSERKELASKGKKETTEEEFMKTAPQLEAMYTAEKAYFDSLKIHLADRSSLKSLKDRLVGGKTGDWSSSEKLSPELEQLKQDWYVKRGQYMEALTDRTKTRVAERAGRYSQTKEGVPGFSSEDIDKIKRPALVAERYQRMVMRRDAIFGAREAELRVREQSLMERHAWVGKLTERWGKMPPNLKAAATTIAFTAAGLAAGVAAGAASPFAGAAAALMFGGGMIAARIGAQRIPANATGKAGIARKLLMVFPSLFQVGGIVSGKASELAAKSYHGVRGTREKGKTAGAIGTIGSQEFGGSLADIDKVRGEGLHVSKSIENIATTGRMAGGAAFGFGLGHYGLSPVGNLTHVLHDAGVDIANVFSPPNADPNAFIDTLSVIQNGTAHPDISTPLTSGANFDPASIPQTLDALGDPLANPPLIDFSTHPDGSSVSTLQGSEDTSFIPSSDRGMTGLDFRGEGGLSGFDQKMEIDTLPGTDHSAATSAHQEHTVSTHHHAHRENGGYTKDELAKIETAWLNGNGKLIDQPNQGTHAVSQEDVKAYLDKYIHDHPKPVHHEAPARFEPKHAPKIPAVEVQKITLPETGGAAKFVHAPTVETTSPEAAGPYGAAGVEARVGEGADKLFERLQSELRLKGYTPLDSPSLVNHILTSKPESLSKEFGFYKQDPSTHEWENAKIYSGDKLVFTKDGDLGFAHRDIFKPLAHDAGSQPDTYVHKGDFNGGFIDKVKAAFDRVLGNISQTPKSPELLRLGDVQVNPDMTTIVADTNGYLSVYGGTRDSALLHAQEYAKAHPGAEVLMDSSEKNVVGVLQPHSYLITSDPTGKITVLPDYINPRTGKIAIPNPQEFKQVVQVYDDKNS